MYMYDLQTSPKGLGDACSTCTTVVNFIKTFVDSSSDEAEVKMALESLCKLFPTNTSKEVHVLYCIHVTGKFGGCFNLAIWRILPKIAKFKTAKIRVFRYIDITSLCLGVCMRK